MTEKEKAPRLAGAGGKKVLKIQHQFTCFLLGIPHLQVLSAYPLLIFGGWDWLTMIFACWYRNE